MMYEQARLSSLLQNGCVAQKMRKSFSKKLSPIWKWVSNRVTDRKYQERTDFCCLLGRLARLTKNIEEKRQLLETAKPILDGICSEDHPFPLLTYMEFSLLYDGLAECCEDKEKAWSYQKEANNLLEKAYSSIWKMKNDYQAWWEQVLLIAPPFQHHKAFV